MTQVEVAVVIIGIIMLLSFLGNLIFKKTDIPSIIWLLGFGLLLGPVFNLVDGEQFLLVSEYVAAFAIVIILFDGGIHLDISQLIKGAPRGALLAVSSFAISVIMTTIIMMLLGNSMLNGILLGAIIGGISSPIVIPIAQKLKSLKDRSKTILSIESAITDPLCIVVAIAVIYMIQTGGGMEVALQSLIQVFSIGAVLGIVSGGIWLPVMNKIRREEFAYVVTLAVSFLIYAGTALTVGGASGTGAGAIAVLLFGIILGNGKKIVQFFSRENEGIQIDQTTKEFHTLISFFITTFFFVYLGIIVNISNTAFIFIGIVLALGMLAIRPVPVMIATLKGDFDKGERQIMSLLIPRGLAAAVLAYIPISYNLPNTNGFADITFTVILTTTLIATIGIAVIDYMEKINNKLKNEKNA